MDVGDTKVDGYFPMLIESSDYGGNFKGAKTRTKKTEIHGGDNEDY